MKDDYVNIKENKITILFPKYLTREKFENILTQCYRKTISKIFIQEIVFSFQHMEWADIFDLGLIALWINKILLNNKRIKVLYPQNTTTYGFLQRVRFIEFIEKTVSSNSQVIIAPRIARNNVVFYPLTFLSYSDFEVLLDDLNFKDRFLNIFNEISNIEIIQSGKLRDIIITELGENMFLHGKGINASISAIAYKETTIENSQNRVKLVSSFEKNFFKALGNKSYIEIIFCDNGIGIYKELVKTYKKDINYPKYKTNPTHADLLEYAFLPYTSSRDMQERINFIEKALDDSVLEDPPVTGLNKLKLVVKEFRGLIYVRSGKGIICYDYLTDAELVFPETNEDKRHRLYKQIASFSGVQYKILIPLEKPANIISQQKKFLFQEVQRKVKYDYIRLDDFFTPDCKYKTDVARKQYLSFENKIENYHIANSEKDIILIFDFCDGGIVNQKLLHFILRKLIELQTHTQLNSFINFPSEYIILFETDFEYKKPIVGYDNKYNRKIFGVSKNDRVIFNSFYASNEEVSSNVTYFKNKFPFLFDLYSNSFIHNRDQILSFSSSQIKERIKAKILDASSNVFHENIKVLIPTNLYCQGYFEIGNLFKNIYNRILIKQWLGIGLNNLKPTYVISLSKHCGSIISDVMIDNKYPQRSIVLETPIKELDFLKLQFNIEKDERILIFTDVISSAKTVSKLIQSLLEFNILHIVSIVNATNFNRFQVPNKEIKISCVLNHPIKYFDKLPSDWLYSEILLTDPKTNLLITQDEFRSKGNLLKQFSINIKKENDNEYWENDFLQKIVISYNLFEEGHFINNNKHFSYLFDIKKMVEKFEPLLVDSISSYFESDLKRRFKNEEEEKESIILFFPYNPGVELLCKSLVKRIPRSKVISIDLKKNKIPLSNRFSEENIIIVDDAFITGESVFNLIDYCEQNGAKKIFVYILINRGTTLSARKLENIKKYGISKVSIRYLFDAQLPYYNIFDCPICIENKHIEELKIILDDSNSKFWNYINISHSIKSKRYITPDFSFVNKNNIGFKLLLRWKIEISKHDLITQKEILNYLDYYDQNIEVVRLLFSIYSFEKDILLKYNIYTSEDFWKLLRGNLIKTGIILLKENSNSDESFRDILDVIFWLETDFVYNNFALLVKNAFDSENNIFEFLFLIFKNKEKFHYRLNAFASLIKNHAETCKEVLEREVQDTIETMVEYFIRKYSDAIRFSNVQREAIRMLFLDSFHEFPRILEALINNLKNNQNYEEALSHWWNIKDIIQKAIRELNMLLNTGLSRNHIELLNNIILELNNMILTNEKSLKTSQTFDLNTIEHISSLIKGKHGIQSVLRLCRVDLKYILNYLNGIYQNKFEAMGILQYTDIPDHQCVVFGDLSDILTSIGNLFENVLTHSQAKKFIVNMKKSDIENFIEIDLFDNGKHAKIIEGTGLRNARKNVEKFLGEFRITDSYDHSEFKTHAQIRLININK